jgi:signal transduction histidine kinase
MPAVLEADLAMDDETLRALESDVRLATHLRALSGVSVASLHDIRTPLHTIGLYVELLRNTLAEGPAPDRQERQELYLGVLASEVESLDGMLNNLFNQIRLGKESPQRLDLAATVTDLLEYLGAEGRRIRIHIQWDPPAEPVFVDIDRDAIRHALTHLLVIAIEATPEGETLGIKVAARDGRASIGITGSAALGERMREGSKSKDEAQWLTGRERGLEVARRVVERHHGTITTRSGASRATTLEIELPLSAVEDR